MASTRAFWGLRLSATTKPRSRRTVRGRTRPLPARLESTTRTPRRRASTSASVSPGVVTPGGSDAAVRVRVAEHAEVRAPERLEPERRGLAHLACGLDLVVEEDEHAEPTRLLRSCNAHRIQEIEPG